MEENFTQLCVWPGTILGNNTIEQFEQFFIDTFHGTRIKFSEIVITIPDMEKGKPVPDTGGRSDIFFYVHNEDVEKFAVSRLVYGIRWWEDVVQNESHLIYPEEIIDKYLLKW